MLRNLYKRLWRSPPWLPALVHALALWRGPNPAYRLDDPAVPASLRDALNAVADEVQRQREDLDARIAEATWKLEQDRDLLAALIERMEGAVVVCAMDGQVLLYNAGLRQVLHQEPALGLGRSLFQVFRRRVVVHFLSQLQAGRPSARGIMASRSGRLYQVRFSQLGSQQLQGFMLAVSALSHVLPGAQAGPGRLQAQRAQLANLKAAVETLIDYPDSPARQRQRLLQVIESETGSLVAGLDDLAEALGRDQVAPLEDISAEDLLALLGERAHLRTELPASALWCRAETMSLALVLDDFVQRCLVGQSSAAALSLMEAKGRPTLRLRWPGPPDPVCRSWERAPMREAPGGFSALTPGQLVEWQGGSLWISETDAGESELTILLEPAEESVAVAPSGVVLPNRPEYFDFDLFQGDAPESERPLRQLVLTAFDTETTGLDPAGGDEIISIGAIRIVNGRVIGQEVFDALVASRRPIHPESQRIHGISREMLTDQPGADEVLPRFHAFCQDGLLLGHNLAFDLRFLDIQGRKLDLRFEQPVLDTLLLSAVVYPERDVHSLEAIAERLGVGVLGRHTALGDAIVTAEVFLRLIPMLEQQGITTLGQALEASRKTWYARLKY